MSDITDIQSYVFTVQDRLLLDTNIWFHIYGPQGKPTDKTKIYSCAFKEMLAKKSSIFLDVLILSEFINRYARQMSPQDGTPFKRFRQSVKFQSVAKQIANMSRRILNCCQCCANGFEQMNAQNLLTDFEQKQLDFNDQILVEICKNNDFIFVTDDSDFKNSGCKVLTANKKLLMSQ